MRVLAGAQPTGVARGSGELSVYSLVAYTLAVEGLAEGKALTSGRMNMAGLLQFVIDRAPIVWRQKVLLQVNQGQLPVLLDFSQRKANGDTAE